jgi:glycine oxidase
MERWWGFRPCTPDEAPLLGTSPIQGLWLATGHHRNGVLLAAITVKLLVGALLGQNTQADLIGAFGWNRFCMAPGQKTGE